MTIGNLFGTTVPKVLLGCFQGAAQSKAIVILFIFANALERIRSKEMQVSERPCIGGVLTVGANGDVDMSAATPKANAFELSNAN